MSEFIARVIVDIALDREFDYLLPDPLRSTVSIGSQVMVPFGRRTIMGYVVGFVDRSDHQNLKSIIRAVDDRPLITETVVKLARWMADYYVCPLEQSVRTVLPSSVRHVERKFKTVPQVLRVALPEDPDVLKRLAATAPRQMAVLRRLEEDAVIPQPRLLADTGATAATLRAMAKKGWLRIEIITQDRNPFEHHQLVPTLPLPLMPQQEEALKTILHAVETRTPPVVLLFGVTGSGKTEVYLQALQQVLARGQGAIVLVPEIALTPQTVERFRSRFGEVVAVLHSHLSGGERHDEWHRLRDGRARIAIGARSALFAPVSNLGLIVVDEEHEQSYKQEEAPRYNARDVAVMRGRMEDCAVVLGTATPSLESLHNVALKKYGMARLKARVDHRRMPHMRIIDMRIEKEKTGRVGIFSGELRDAIRHRLDRKEQTILFLNRRGFSTSLICPACGYVAECGSCSVSMTYHKKAQEMRCHICGAVRKVPVRCPNTECNSPEFRFAGTGTQRVEEIVAKLFPKASIARMDADTTTRKEAYGQILNAFRAGETDILLGTQMIAKGLDYPNVTLVGVINADIALHMPDFRAGERTFQLLTQVAGRAGRGDVAGEVIVQTYTPFHPAIQAARRLDYDGFLDQEEEMRRELFYPPFSRLICVTLKGKKEPEVEFSGKLFAKQMEALLVKTVRQAGPMPAPLARAKGDYRFHLIYRAARVAEVTGPMKQVLKKFPWPRGVRYSIDVDALSLI